MTPEQWERVKDLLEAASGLDPAQREAFLAEACADEEVRAEVESLLAEEKRAGGFLGGPVLARSEAPAAPPELPTQISDLALEKIRERYEILAKVGEGGMGIVYRARDRETNDLVALKILKPEIAAQPRVIERFKQELRLARKVTHKNVCRTHELLRFDDTVVIAMEYVEGESLREVLKRPGGVRLGRALEWTAQICDALAEAHAQGVVHRDLKPENILIDGSGQVKVMDFGIARSLEAGTTTTGMIVGTPAYMAPEQAEGKAADHRSDIYALGLILYEMFTGKVAFHADTPVGLAFKHVHEAPVPPREQDPLLPEYIEKAVLKCLEKDPARRFQSAKDLRRALTEAPIAPARIKLAFPAVVWSLVFLAIMAAPLIFLGKWLAKVAQPSSQRLTFRHGSITSARFHPSGTVVYSATWEGEPEEVFRTDSRSPESSSLGLRECTIFAVSQEGEMLLQGKNSNLQERAFNGGGIHELRKDVEWADWAPDGKNYALVYDAAGNDRIEYPAGSKVYETTGSVSDLRISPDGGLVAFIEHPIQDDARGSVVVVDKKGKKTVLSSEYLSARGLAWSPRGREVWFTAGKVGHARALYAVTLSGKERLVQRTPGTLYLRDISSDGRVLLELANERQFLRGMLRGDKAERDLSWLDYSSATDISTDGRSLLFDEEGDGGGAKHGVYLRKTGSSAPVRLGDGIAGGLSRDGKWALSILDTPPRRLLLLPTSAEAGGVEPLPQGAVDVFISADWFPDGKHILFNAIERNHRLRCYAQDITGGDPVAVTPEGTYFCSPSPDNSSILATGPKNTVSIYPLTNGKPTRVQGLESEDEVIGFAEDARHIFIYRQGERRTEAFNLYRFDTATGKRELRKQIKLPDPAVDTLDSMVISPDGRFYVCNLVRTISDLYIIDGLK